MTQQVFPNLPALWNDRCVAVQSPAGEAWQEQAAADQQLLSKADAASVRRQLLHISNLLTALQHLCGGSGGGRAPGGGEVIAATSQAEQLSKLRIN